MSDIVERLRIQSTMHNSSWVMALFAEAADYIEQLEQQTEPVDDKVDKPYDAHTQYDEAMRIL